MKRFVLAAAAAATMLVSGTAQALTFKYGSFSEEHEWLSFNYTNNGGATPSGTLNANSGPGANVKFRFYDDPSDGIPLPTYLTTEQHAILSLTSSVSQAATVAGGVDVTQYFDAGTISFTGAADSAYAGANILTVNFSKLKFSGTLGEDSSGIMSSTPSTSMTITSDFFGFSNVTGSNFAWSMVAMVPSLTIGANGAIASFQANLAGEFASNPAPLYVPEPAMLGLFGAGAAGLAFARRRKS